MKVLLCVTGGIAAYKAAEVLRNLKESGCEVTVAASESALAFVGEPTWAALSGKPVARSIWARPDEVPHVSLARWADVIAVVPATADCLARLADGRADDIVTASCLMADSPVVVFPAMHTEMWQHRATAAHAATLRARGVLVTDPDSGRLTGADSGVGRLGDPAAIAMIIRAAARRAEGAGSLAGRHVVITAGGTREPIDPVRVVTNTSSGQMGYAISAAAAAAGARVTLICANVAMADMAGARVVRVSTHAQLAEALDAAVADDADAVIMAAAVSDYAPTAAPEKVKKSGGDLELTLHELPDILAGLARRRTSMRPVLVGFAAETAAGARLLELAREKLVRKGCDLIVANDVSNGAVFGQGWTSIAVISADSDSPVAVAADVSKEAAASAVVEVLAARLA